jgi:hypothetical protein
VNIKLSGMLKGSGRGLFKVLSRHFEKNHENCVCIFGAPCRRLKGNLPRLNEKFWLLSCFAVD